MICVEVTDALWWPHNKAGRTLEHLAEPTASRARLLSRFLSCADSFEALRKLSILFDIFYLERCGRRDDAGDDVSYLLSQTYQLTYKHTQNAHVIQHGSFRIKLNLLSTFLTAAVKCAVSEINGWANGHARRIAQLAALVCGWLNDSEHELMS